LGYSEYKLHGNQITDYPKKITYPKLK
jgi:hypothetical protein